MKLKLTKKEVERRTAAAPDLLEAAKELMREQEQLVKDGQAGISDATLKLSAAIARIEDTEDLVKKRSDRAIRCAMLVRSSRKLERLCRRTVVLGCNYCAWHSRAPLALRRLRSNSPR